MGGKPQHLQEVSADDKRHIIQAVAHYCGTSPTGSNTTTGHIRRLVEVLEERIPVGRNMPSGSSRDSTFTSYLADKAVMEDAPASIGRRK